MTSLFVALTVFVCLFGASMFTLHTHHLLAEKHRSKETQESVRLGIGMISAVTALVLGLMTAWVQSSFGKVRGDLQTFATELVVLDSALRDYGAAADPARRDLVRYTDRAIRITWPAKGRPAVIEDYTAEALLHRAHLEILGLQPGDDLHRQLGAETKSEIDTVIAQRWGLIEEAGFAISPVMLTVLVLWLSSIFASFGYSSPANNLVRVTFFLCAASIAGAMFLIVELGDPFGGIMQVSQEPLRLALNHMLNHQYEHVVLPPN